MGALTDVFDGWECGADFFGQTGIGVGVAGEVGHGGGEGCGCGVASYVSGQI